MQEVHIPGDKKQRIIRAAIEHFPFISAEWGHTVSRGFLGNDTGVDNWSWGYNQSGKRVMAGLNIR